MRIWSFLLAFFNFFAFGQISNNILLLDQWSNDNLVTNSLQNRYNECFGFTHLGEEYAVLGSSEGTHIFLIDNNNNFQEKGFIRGAFSHPSVVHRDYKTYKNFLYAVCDEGPSTLQIIDFKYLPDSVHLAADLASFGRNHNLGIDSTNALLYCFSQKGISGGLPINSVSMKVYSLDNPLSPVEVFGGFTDIPEVHDGLIKDNIAILNCGFDGLRRYDFTNPAAPIFIQDLPIYQEQGYNHQGDINPNGDTYIFADETTGKKLKKCSVGPNGELKIDAYFGTDFDKGSVPHNVLLDDRFAYVAYYNLGLRIYDYRSSPIEEIAFYDTYPEETAYKLNGMWGVYPKLPSGRILASDRKYGLFLFDFNKNVFANRKKSSFQVYPNPVSGNQEFTVFLNENYKDSWLVRLLDFTGKEIISSQVNQQNFYLFKPELSAGCYQLVISYEQNRETKTERFPIVIF